MFYSYDKIINDGTYCFATKDDANFNALCFDNKGSNCDATHGTGYSNSIHMDWQNTIGESMGALTVQTTKNNEHYSMKVRYYIKDIYEWAYHYDDDNLSLLLHSMHEAGFSQEFLMDGIFEFTIEWDGTPEPKNSDIMKQIAIQMIPHSEPETFREYNCFGNFGVKSFR